MIFAFMELELSTYESVKNIEGDFVSVSVRQLPPFRQLSVTLMKLLPFIYAHKSGFGWSSWTVVQVLTSVSTLNSVGLVNGQMIRKTINNKLFLSDNNM